MLLTRLKSSFFKISFKKRIGVIAISLGLFGFLTHCFLEARLVKPNPTAIVLNNSGEFVAYVVPNASNVEIDKQGYGFWQIETVPKKVEVATLALEDKRFWSHFGVDFIGVARAFWQNFRSKKIVSGASTIAMQIARMQNPRPRNYYSKIREALVAIFLVLKNSRDEVLKHYLSLVPYGNQAHGIAFASRIYLDKPVVDLSFAEIAFLSAIPQAPSRMNPFNEKGRKRAIKRGERILKTFFDEGLISEGEYQFSLKQLKALRFPPKKQRSIENLHAIMQFEKKLVEINYAKQKTEPIYHSGIDFDIQEKLTNESRKLLFSLKERGAENISALVLELPSMEIKAWLGSGGYFDTPSGAIDYADILRSSGSTIKPFIYALAVNQNKLATNKILDDLPEVARGVKNSDDRFLGPLLPRKALANSRNIPAANLSAEIGVENVCVFAQNLGLGGQKKQPCSSYGTTVALGGMPVSLLELAKAYGIFANDGFLKDIVFFKEQKSQNQQAFISTDTARLVSHFLSDNLARMPSFERMGATEYPFAVALKTGTSQGYRDAWIIAWSKKYMVAVWIGRPDAEPMKDITGGNSSAKLAKEMLLWLHEEDIKNYSYLNFPNPESYKQERLCAYTGRKYDGLCSLSVTEWVPENDEISSIPTIVSLPIDLRNQKIARIDTPKKYLKFKKFIDLPSRYKDWAKQNGLELTPIEVSNLSKEGEIIENEETLWIPENENIKIVITSPSSGSTIYFNPEMPENLNILALRAIISREVPQAVWYVNDKAWKVVEPPYTANWQMQKGEHFFEIKIPNRPEKSGKTKVRVK